MSFLLLPKIREACGMRTLLCDVIPVNFLFRIRQAPNARHHPPAAAIDVESRAIAGRVHAVVRFRPSLGYLSLSATHLPLLNCHLAGWRDHSHHRRDSMDSQGSHHSLNTTMPYKSRATHQMRSYQFKEGIFSHHSTEI